MAAGPGGSHEASLSLASGVVAARWNSCCSVVTTACTGALAGSPALVSASIAVDHLLSASLGWPPTRLLTAPVPAVGGWPDGAAAAATASAARYDASLSPLDGIASRSGPQPGRFSPSNELGLVCRPGRVPQFCCAIASLSCGRIASTTGEVTSERLSLTVLSPA